MKKIIYIGYLSDINNENRKSAPSADTKMKYIISSIKESGNVVSVISCTVSQKRDGIFKKQRAYSATIEGTDVQFISSYTSKFRLLRIVGRFCSWISLKKIIKKICFNNNTIVLIYHSLNLNKLQKYFIKKRKKYILEVEEIYGDVLNDFKIKKNELNLAANADKYIFPTYELNNLVNVNDKPYVIVHGTYKVEKKFEHVFMDNKIHCVYAGTFDTIKGGCLAAIDSALYLDDNYHMHILGFGDENQVLKIKDEIKKISELTNCIITYDGLKYGDEYLKFIQSCDIGLSTQNPNGEYNNTSFPSKILSYMSNGLKVVTIGIPVVLSSNVGRYLYYYDDQDPVKIAETIKSVDLTSEFSSESILRDLDLKFIKDIKNLLGE